MRNVRLSWLTLSASVVIGVSGCAQTGAIGSSGAESNDQSSALAAHRAQRADMNACLAQMRQAAQAGASGQELGQMRQNCIARSNAIMMQARNQQLAEDVTISGKFTRALIAASEAENAGNDQEALRIYKSIDADADVINAEAARLAPRGAAVSLNTNPATNQDILNGNALTLQLAAVQGKIGRSYEQAGRYDEAAAYYQKALNTKGVPNGDGMIIGERLAFLYANGLGVAKDQAKARQLFSVRDSQRSRIDLALLDRNMLPKNPEGVPDAERRMDALAAEEQKIALERQEKAAEEATRQAQAWRAAHPELARAQDCRASCEREVQSCKARNSGMNWQVPFGGWAEREYDCDGFKNRCYALCP